MRTGAQGGPRLLETSFNGHRFDEVSGLYYFQARHYDPVLGRFISADSQVPDPQNPRALNRFAFNYNNPIRYTDPTGHDFLDFLKGALVWILAAALIIALVILFVPGGGALATAIIVGALVGAAVGGIVGAIAAYKAGFSITSTEFWVAVAGGMILGAFVGAAIGATIGMFTAAGSFAAAFKTSGMAALVLIGAASGSALGGYSAYKVNGGFTDDFAMDFFLWGAVGAAAVYVLGFFGVWAQLPVTLGAVGQFVVATATILVLSGGYAYGYYCARTNSCGSPVGVTGETAEGPLGNTLDDATAYEAQGPLAGATSGIPAWLLQGTIAEQFRARDPSTTRSARAAFVTTPLAP